MNNEAFFDILGELDDDIISDAAQLAVPVSSKKTNVKSLFMIAAAVMIFIISGFIVTENIKTGNMGLYESTSESVLQNTTEYETLEEPSVTAEQTTEEPSQESTVPDVSTTASSTVTTEVLTTSANIVTNPYIDPDITPDEPSENPTEMTEEQTTSAHIVTNPYIEPDEPSSSEDEPSEPDLGLPPTEPPLMGEAVPDGPRPFFIEVPAAAFLEFLPRDSFDTDKYVKAENVSGHIIEDIYGTKIIPDYIPTGASSGPTVDALPSEDIKNRTYTVYFTADSLEVYSSQEFSFLTRSGVLTVKASTEPFPLYKEEKINTDSRSLINDVPVLLLSGMLSDKNAVLDAQFEKDGVYFRVILRGNNLIEEEFIKILESLI